MVSFIFALIFSTTSFADGVAKLSEGDCINRNYTHRFGAVRDQEDLGYCYAFAATALAEEEFCLEDSKNCGVHYSPIDASRCEFNGGRGGDTMYALLCMAENRGVCAEKYAPYGTETECGGIFGFLPDRSVSCMRDRLEDLFEKYRECRDTEDYRRALMAMTMVTLDRVNLGLNLERELRAARTKNFFVYHVMAPRSCAQNRKAFARTMEMESYFAERERVDMKFVNHKLVKAELY
jgi:hypothetical protein